MTDEIPPWRGALIADMSDAERMLATDGRVSPTTVRGLLAAIRHLDRVQSSNEERAQMWERQADEAVAELQRLRTLVDEGGE